MRGRFHGKEEPYALSRLAGILLKVMICTIAGSALLLPCCTEVNQYDFLRMKGGRGLCLFE